MENNYIQKLLKQIKNKNAKIAIEEEIYSHILDKTDYYIDIGYTPEEAIQKANEDMGDADDSAVPLNVLHSQKWYKRTQNWLVIGLMLIQSFVLLYIYQNMHYKNDINFGLHLITFDFISLLFLGINFFIIHIGRKQKNKTILFSAAIELAYQLFFNPYQPLFYGIEKTIFSSYNSYVDSIFEHSAIPLESAENLFTCSLILISILLTYCGLSLLGIFAQERAYTQKHFWKPYKIFEAVVSVFIICNLAFISFSTYYAYSNIEAKKQELKELHHFQIETILNLQLNENSTFESITSELENIYTQQNYNFSKHTGKVTEDETYARISIKNTNMYVDFIHSGNFENMAMVTYSINTYNNKVLLIDDDIYCKMSEFAFIRDGMSLDDFLSNDLYKKSVYILNTNDGQLTFGFIITDGNENKLVNINFLDDVYTMDSGMFSEADTDLINFLKSIV